MKLRLIPNCIAALAALTAALCPPALVNNHGSAQTADHIIIIDRDFARPA